MSMTDPTPPSRPSLPMERRQRLAAALPFVATAVVVAVLGVNVLKADEWDAIGAFLIDVKQHGLSLAALWAPHNEHRMPLPRLIFALLSWHGPHLVLGMLLSLAVLGLTFAALFRRFVEPALQATRTTSLRRSGLAMLFAALYFSFGQKENLLWNFQLAWSLALFGFVHAALALYDRRSGRFFAGLLLCYLCSAHFVALYPLALLDSGRRLARAHRTPSFWSEVVTAAGRLIALAALLLLYLRGAPHASLAALRVHAAAHPLQLVGYPLALLGNVHYWHGADPTAPLALLGGLLFIGLLVALWARGQLRLADPEAYLFVAMLSLIGVISIGRAAHGLHQALDSRYQPCTLFGWLVLLALVLRKSGQRAWVPKLVLVCLLNVQLASLSALRAAVVYDHAASARGLACQEALLHAQQTLDRSGCAGLLYPDPARQQALTWALHQLGLL
jgi:hypothetical protein